MPRSLLWPDPRARPPVLSGAVEIDWGHPLTKDLTCAVLPPFGDFVLQRRASSVIYFSEYGSGSLGTYRPLDDGALSTMAMRIRFNAAPSVNQDIGSLYYVDSGNNQFETISWVNATTRIDLLFQKNSGGGFGATIEASPVTFPKINHYAATFNRTANSATAYRNGVAVVSKTAAGSVPSADNRKALYYGFTNGPMVSSYYYRWKYILPANYLLWVMVEPYAIFRPIIRRRYSIPHKIGPLIHAGNPQLITAGGSLGGATL